VKNIDEKLSDYEIEVMDYFGRINDFITQHNMNEPLLELEGTDEDFCISVGKLHIAGFKTGQPDKVIGALTMDAVKSYHHHKDGRDFSLLFLKNLEKNYYSDFKTKNNMTKGTRSAIVFSIVGLVLTLLINNGDYDLRDILIPMTPVFLYWGYRFIKRS